MKITESVKNKIKSCKALQGKTIFDVVKMDEFATNLEAYIKCQREDREQTRASFKAMKQLNPKAKLPAHVIDHFEKWETKDFIYEYMRILQAKSGCGKNERIYILQLCQQAYNKTVADFVVAEFPELRELYFPKAN